MSLNIEYNNRYLISKHDWKLNGNTIAGYNYGHDSVGNRIWSENLVTSNKSELFAFDNADRLTSFKTGTLNGSKTAITTPTYMQDWNLDSIGNWAGFNDNGTNSTNVFSDTHEMTEFKGVIQTFDNNGNLIFDGVRAFKYDAFNRIIEVKIGTIILAEYQYDAFNRRVVKKVDADLNNSFETITKFLYDGFRCIEELNGSDVLVQDYVYGSLYIDEVILQRTGATDYYFTHEYRYSVTNLTNTSGNIVESYDYKVYGQRTASGAGLTDVGYTGQRHDVETGLMYFKNRYYSVSMGQFVTRDPKKYINGMSMYLGYFGGQGRDPMGLEDNDSFLKAVDRMFLDGKPTKLTNEEIKKRSDDRKKVIEEMLKKSTKENECPSSCVNVTLFIELGHSMDDYEIRKVGHAGIALDEAFYDFGPSSSVGAGQDSPGSQYWDNPSDPRYWDKGTKSDPSDINKSDIINNISKLARGYDVITITYIVTKEEAANIEKYWKNLYSDLKKVKKDPNRPIYNVPGLQCASSVAQSLFNAKRNNLEFSAYSPENLMRLITGGRFKHSCGPDKGKSAYIKQINTEKKWYKDK